jgi:hypothetical protein
MASLSEMDRLGISLTGTLDGACAFVSPSHVSPNLKKLVDELYNHLEMKSPDIVIIDNEEEFSKLIRGVGRDMEAAIDYNGIFFIINMIIAGLFSILSLQSMVDGGSKIFLPIFIIGCFSMLKVGFTLSENRMIRDTMLKHFKNSGPIESLASGRRVRKKLVEKLQSYNFFDQTTLSEHTILRSRKNLRRSMKRERAFTAGLSLMWRHPPSSYQQGQMPFAMIPAFNKASTHCAIKCSYVLNSAAALNNAVDAALLGDGCVVLLVSQYAL